MQKKYTGILIVATAFILMLPVSGSAWEDGPPPLRERLYFGGNFGLSFGNITSVIVSPLAGYHITPRLSAGRAPQAE